MGTEIGCLVAVVLLVAMTQLCSAEMMRCCYFHNTVFNTITGPPLIVDRIDLSLCTHFIYAHAHIDSAGRTIKATMPAIEEGEEGMYRKFVDNVISDPSVRAMLSVGGPTETSQAFEAITSTDAVLETFAGRALNFLRVRHFDGLVVDWQFPDSEIRKGKLTKLLQALRRAFNDLKEPALLLTVSGPGLATKVDAGFDVPQIAIYADYVFVQAYNLVLPNNRQATFYSALFHNPTSGLDRTLNVNYSVHHWIEQGLPTAKIVVGLTGRGSYFKLAKREEFEPGSRVTSEVQISGYYNLTSGMMYPQICTTLKKNPTARHFDPVQKNPYLVVGDLWIGYEDKESLLIKLQWIMSLGVAGFVFAGLHEDDFTGQLCLDGVYPLLTSIFYGEAAILSRVAETTVAVHSTSLDFRPSMGSESSEVLIYLASVFIFAGSVTAYGLYVFLTRDRGVPSFSE